MGTRFPGPFLVIKKMGAYTNSDGSEGNYAPSAALDADAMPTKSAICAEDGINQIREH